MNKEIKEILEIFKQVDLEQEVGGCYYCPKKDKDKTCIGCLNNAKDKLLDYINNLQQEKEKAIEYIENNSLYDIEYDEDIYENNTYMSGANDEIASRDLLNILKGKEDEEN